MMGLVVFFLTQFFVTNLAFLLIPIISGIITYLFVLNYIFKINLINKVKLLFRSI